MMIALVVSTELPHGRPIAIAANVRTVALGGQHAPGTPGNVNFRDFNVAPVINDSGKTAFWAVLTSTGRPGGYNDTGIWSEGSGELALVAVSGNQPPDSPEGSKFAEFDVFSFTLNDAGKTAFTATYEKYVDATLVEGRVGLWSEGFGSLAPVARSVDVAPESPGVYFSSFHPPLLNNVGQTAFGASAFGNGIFWSPSPGTLGLVANDGFEQPGIPEGSYFLLKSLPVLNDAGQTAFSAQLNTADDWGIWSGTPDNLLPVARTGDHAPGAPVGTNFLRLGHPVVNSAGKTAFGAILRDDPPDGVEFGVWSEGSGGLELVARTGDPAPGLPTDTEFRTIYIHSVVLNDAGKTAFYAENEGYGSIWSNAPGALTLVAATDQHAPGTPDGVKFGGFTYHYRSFVLNEAGQCAFICSLFVDGVEPDVNDRGIWATDLSGVLQLIVRTGDQLEVAPGEFRTVAGLDFVGNTGNGDGRRSGFNNLGQVAFYAKFTDQSDGIFVSNAVARLPADFNADGAVDGADLAQWRGDFGLNGDSDADHDGDSDGADFLAWQRQFGIGPNLVLPTTPAVPEPGSLLVAAACSLGLLVTFRRSIS
jgi:hypothetical protein